MDTLRKPYAILAALIASISLFSNSASAVQTINFPNVMTNNLVFSEIEESNNSIISGQTLFGGLVPLGTSDVLRLQTTNFSLSTAGTSEILTGNFDATITAKPGQKINSITITELGSASTFGVGSFAYVLLESSIDDGTTLHSDSRSYTMTGVAGPPSSELWTRSMTFSFDPTDEILLSLRNQLISASLVGGVSSIDKDKIRIAVNTVAIPEPSSVLAIMGLGLVGTAVRRRRRV